MINNSAVDSNAVSNPLSIATKLFDQHPSIINIKKKKFDSVVNFKKASSTEVEKVIDNLSIVKACKKDDIITKVIKINKDIFAGFITKDFNNCVDKGVFPDDLKHADVTPIHKKKDKSDKTNYACKLIRPVSILPNISKIYEKLIYNQLYDYFEDILSPSQCGFLKGHSTRHCLLAMLEKFKESEDKGNEFSALLTDLSKAFDCIDHKLLIAKLFSYGVSPSSLNLIFSYLSSRTQRVKIKTSYSDKSNIEYGVPQGLILGSLLLNIGSTDLFFECDDSEIASYADDTAPYSCADDIPSVITELQSTASKFFSWFTNNHMKVNPGKCHILLSTKNAIDVYLERACITSSSCEKLLGIKIDSDLKFHKHISDLCDTVSKKINALCRITGYMFLEKRRIVMKTFVESEFNYCPLIWMLHSRILNYKINRLHERALRTVYSDYKSSFNTTVEKVYLLKYINFFTASLQLLWATL